jgi:hypothetical protein
VTRAAALKPSGLQAAVAVSVPKLKDDEWLAKFLTVVVTAEEVGLFAVLLHLKLAEPAPSCDLAKLIFGQFDQDFFHYFLLIHHGLMRQDQLEEKFLRFAQGSPFVNLATPS